MAEVWIYVTHPDVKGDPVRVSLDSFTGTFEKRGWVAVDAPVSAQESSRETFSRVFGDVSKRDAVKGPKKKPTKK
jgi:hypothetical protein